MCAYVWRMFCLGAIRTLPTKFMILSLIHTPFANVAMLSLETHSGVGAFILDIVSFALPSSGTPVLSLQCRCCCSNSAITPLSALGIVTSPSVFRVSRAIAETKGWLRKF